MSKDHTAQYGHDNQLDLEFHVRVQFLIQLFDEVLRLVDLVNGHEILVLVGHFSLPLAFLSLFLLTIYPSLLAAGLFRVLQ